MGCSGSRLAENKQKLYGVQHVLDQKTQIPPAHYLQALHNGAKALQETSSYFHDDRKGKDQVELATVQSFADALTLELVALIDLHVVQGVHAEVKLPAILDAAGVLDTFRTKKASTDVNERVQALRSDSVADLLSKAARKLSTLNAADQLLQDGKSIVALLSLANDEVKDATDLVPQMLQHATTLAVKILALLPEVVEHGVTSGASSPLVAITDLAKRLDAIALERVQALGATWERLAPKVLVVAATHRSKSVPSLLSALEAELSKGAGGGMNPKALVLSLNRLVAWWESPTAEMQTRVAAIFSQMDERVAEAFDKSLAAAELIKMDALQRFAKDVDTARASLLGIAHQDATLQRKLATQKASVSIETLIASSRNHISDNVAALHTAFREADALVKAVPRDQFDVSEGVAWKFKRKQGSFTAFDSAKSAEVEKLYQGWVAKEKPKDLKSRRFTISIASTAEPGRRIDKVPTDSISNSIRKPRERCKHGETCYRKNPEHRRENCHPGDWDWDPPTADQSAGLGSPPPTDSAVLSESYSLDFLLMTQVCLSRRSGMRSIQREEKMPAVLRHTRDYFGKLREFAQGVGNMLSSAEVEIRMLGENEQKEVQEQINKLLEDVRPGLQEFLTLAVLVKDSKSLDEVVALLGASVEALGIHDMLKDMRLKDVLNELYAAYLNTTLNGPTGLRKWKLVRQLAGQKLLRPRWALEKTKYEHLTLARRRAQMQCQALLSEYAGDGNFCSEFRSTISYVLEKTLTHEVATMDIPVWVGIIRTASALQCDTAPLALSAGSGFAAAIGSACRAKLQPVTRVFEVLDLCADIAKASGKHLDDICDFRDVFLEVGRRGCREIRAGEKELSDSVRRVVMLRNKMIHQLSSQNTGGFDKVFWDALQPIYEVEQSHMGTVEWAIAFCEQTKQSLPPWMMNQNQVEALKKLKHAIEREDEQALREAVVFAKQTDHSDNDLQQAYDDALSKLKKVKRLPAGWEVDGLVGDDDKAKMFKQVDFSDSLLVSMFQSIFDQTTLHITTRDRTGAVPRGFKVHRITEVQNADSWSSYLKRRDEVALQCARKVGVAPYPDSVWNSWSGKVATLDRSQEILMNCQMPPLDPKANEFLMFHGTKPDAADSIAKNHFDMAFACKTGLFGAGLYLAESCSKSDEYVKPDDKGHYPVMLVRTTLGNINYCASVDPTTDPGRDKLQNSCTAGDYHSVLGDRKKARGTYREFIIYDHYQVYPQYIVWYSRL